VSALVNADSALLQTQENEIPPFVDIAADPMEQAQENHMSEQTQENETTPFLDIATDPMEQAQEKQMSEKTPSQSIISTELRAAAFFSMNHKFRKIYGTAGLSLQAEVGKTFQDLRNLGVWISGEWIFMNGKPLSRSCGSTSIDIFNVGFGVKGIGQFFNDALFLYGGIGPNVGLVCIENKIRCSSNCNTKKKHRSRAAIGVLVKTGAEIYFTHHFYFSFFTNYVYLPAHFGRTIDAGGIQVGGGFGALF